MIYYGAGQCRMDYKQTIACLEIRYKGTGEFRKNNPNGWLFQVGGNKIIILALQKEVPLNEVLFTYEGNIKLLSVKAVNWELEQQRLPVSIEGVYYPELINSYPETMDIPIEKMSQGMEYNPKGKRIRKSKVMGRIK